MGEATSRVPLSKFLEITTGFVYEGAFEREGNACEIRSKPVIVSAWPLNVCAHRQVTAEDMGAMPTNQKPDMTFPPKNRINNLEIKYSDKALARRRHSAPKCRHI